MASILFIVWFLSGRKGGYGAPTALDLKKGEKKKGSAVVQTDVVAPHNVQKEDDKPKVRDVTPQMAGLNTPPTPPGPPPQAFFVYNGHDWDAYEVLGVSPYSSFSEITKVYQATIRKADPGKHDFLQAAYMAILKKF